MRNPNLARNTLTPSARPPQFSRSSLTRCTLENYNCILGYPALAKFMAVTHHAYNMVKIPDSGGTIAIQGNVQDATRAVETAYKAAATAFPADEGMEPLQRPAKKKQLFQQEQTATKKVPLGVDSTGAGGSGASVTIGAGLPTK